jgi:hypothetical protein
VWLFLFWDLKKYFILIKINYSNCEGWTAPGGYYKDYYFLGCDATECVKFLLCFRGMWHLVTTLDSVTILFTPTGSLIAPVPAIPHPTSEPLFPPLAYASVLNLEAASEMSANIY